jgi:two-component system chemotaxis response regulator CheB
VAATVDCGEKALQIIERVTPDVISMDIRLPGINGFETTQKIMQLRPTPIVVVSASVEKEDLKISMNALRAGALSVVEKPLNFSHESYDKLAQTICTQLAIMSEVKVVSQRLARSLTMTNIFGSSRGSETPHPTIPDRGTGKRPYQWVGIVASTGGPKALSEILAGLPRNFPLPIAVVQHIAPSFHDGFVSWLDSTTELSVIMAKGPVIATAGNVYLSIADHHLVLQNHYALSYNGPPVCRQRPSGNVLFESMARQFGPRAIGVLLTGMGEDGALGLKAIKDAGGYTIAQDKATSVVYGMPAAAVEIGAACESLPLDKMTVRLQQLTTQIPQGMVRYENR